MAGGNAAAPRAALAVLDGAVEHYRLFMLNAHRGIPARPGVVHETCFVGPGMRRSPTLSYVPARLSLVPRLFATTLPPDVVRGDRRAAGRRRVLARDRGQRAARRHRGVQGARRSGRRPGQRRPCRGPTATACSPSDDVDYALVADAPLDVPPPSVLDDAARGVGERLAALVPDGATLQMGIGTVPDATLPGLVARRGLAVWSEMFSDGVLALDRAGALDASAPLTASFLYGTPELYAWVDRNPRVQVLRTETTNSPARIAACRAMTSINTALQVDLFGQANASRDLGADPLRLRRPDRLHRRCAALATAARP